MSEGAYPQHRATCPVCGKRVPLTTSGVFRKHRVYASVCPQSGSEPGRADD